jgi:alkylation response protein AidB-like acyl-CoA dehydrogenase
MDFDDTPAEAAYRAVARQWLATHAPAYEWTRAFDVNAADHVERCQAWQSALYEGGWAGITWPAAYGGRGGTALEQSIFNQEQSRYRVSTGAFAVGIGMVGPTLIAHGSDAQRDRYLDAMLRGQELWCQLFSEPGAGSDLAGLATRAERDGDEFVVNGQKVWTSGAHYSDFGILLARTNADRPKHRGITYFIVAMSSPGIEVRPLRQITGHAHFNEVFLTDVRVPAANVVGEIDGGWGVAHTTLVNERTLIGAGAGGTGRLDRVIALARRTGAHGDRVVRDRLADAYVHEHLLRFLGYRVQTAASQGRAPGPESSVLKLAYSQHASRLGDLALAVQGAAGTLGGCDAADAGRFEQDFLAQWSSKIGGGTDQIQRNVIGERVLGLPAEPRVDKDVPFRELSGRA